MRKASLLNTSCEVSVGNAFLISFPNKKCVETLKSSSAHSWLWKAWLVWQPNGAFLAKLEQFFTFQKGVSLFFSHALPISLNTLTLELSLFQRVASLSPRLSSVRPRGCHTVIWKVRKAFLATGVHPENFPGPHQCQDAIRQGAQRSIVTQSPRLGACWEGAKRKTLNVIVI